MNRREFIQDGLTTSAALALAAPRTRIARKPNVLYLFTDEHRASSLPGREYNDVIAPNIQAFQQNSFTMQTCVSNYPLCSPHRAILLSGRWPYQTGVTENDLHKLNPSKEVSLGETFRRNGYHTGYIGKWHVNGPGRDIAFIPPGPDRHGFEDWNVWGATANHYAAVTFDQNTGERTVPQGYGATLMTDQAVRFIETQPKEKPWLLIVSWNPPHPPFDPPKEEMELYDSAILKWRPNVTAADSERWRRAQQGYNGHITAIDREFARLMKALDDTGQAADTIVIFTSDHGEMMGSHGQMHKRLPWEESCIVPFFVRSPGITRPGSSSGILFSSIDIYPTVCGLAGIPVPAHCMGKNCSPAIRGERLASPRSVFLMNMDLAIEGSAAEPEIRPSWRGVRTPTHTYAVASTGRWLLYDNAADPFQIDNLIGDPAHAEVRSALETELQRWLKAASDPFPLSAAMGKTYTLPG